MAAQQLVSVVIPCHNYASFLAEAIESVLRQTYQPIEVVVVDDGSVDETRAVAARYPVKLLSQLQSGVCRAVNNGMREAQGEFAMRLDADDALESTYVAETRAALERHPEAQFAYTQVAYFGAKTGTYPICDFDLETLAERNYIHGSALMRREAFQAVGGYDWRLDSARCEDWDLWLAFADHGFTGVLVPKPLLLYRQHNRSSRNTLSWVSPRVMQRNLMMTARLQENHPKTFAASALLRRLKRLPGRLRRGEVSVSFAVLLASFYSVMLARSLGRVLKPHATATS